MQTNGGGGSAVGHVHVENTLTDKNLEYLVRDQVGKVAKENQEALPELVNVTERYVFFF